MPTYVYRIIRPTGPEELFEIRQPITAPALTVHPETGEPVERVILPPQIGKGAQGNAEIAGAGFTKYKRMSDGTYERQAGTGGPKHVNPHGNT